MNHTKEWHETNNQSSQIQHYSPSMDYQPSSILPYVNKSSESEARLPGMMALSQPGTPRPNIMTSPKKEKYNPYTHAALNRKRGRNELFSTELGPFFSSTKPVDNLYALDKSTLLTVRIQAKMDRGFFLADNDWTCYRRNYFQVSGAFTVHGLTHYHDPPCLVEENGSLYPVYGFSMNISARVSNGDKKIDLVQHTPKRDKGPQTTPSPKPIIPGGNLSMSSVGGNQTIVTFDRIQFKTATANNGKRRAAQQYYVCLVDVYAEIEGGARRVKVASCQSAPLVVRGRSPGHYSDNHDKYEAQPQPNSHENGYATPFLRPPMTPPAAIGTEYGSPYPYSPYPSGNFPQFNSMQSGIMPPTPTNGPLPPPHPHQQHYMVPGMSSDPSSSETSSPDLYNNNNEDTKNYTRGSYPSNSSYFSQSPYPPYTRKYSLIQQQTS